LMVLMRGSPILGGHYGSYKREAVGCRVAAGMATLSLCSLLKALS
jgi:hypothetical protein